MAENHHMFTHDKLYVTKGVQCQCISWKTNTLIKQSYMYNFQSQIYNFSWSQSVNHTEVVTAQKRVELLNVFNALICNHNQHYCVHKVCLVTGYSIYFPFMLCDRFVFCIWLVSNDPAEIIFTNKSNISGQRQHWQTS